MIAFSTAWMFVSSCPWACPFKWCDRSSDVTDVSVHVVWFLTWRAHLSGVFVEMELSLTCRNGSLDSAFFAGRWYMIHLSSLFFDFATCFSTWIFNVPSFLKGHVRAGETRIKLRPTCLSCASFMNGSCLSEIRSYEFIRVPISTFCRYR